MKVAQPGLPLDVALPANDLLPLVSITILAIASILAVFVLAFVLNALLVVL